MKRNRGLSIVLALAITFSAMPSVVAGTGREDAVEVGGVEAAAVGQEDNFTRFLHDMYDEIETEYRPDVRWWLAEGLNTDETLKKNIQEIYDSGFGAAEFLAMPEPGADSEIYGWGSEEWTSDTRLIIEEATKLGLGFSLTSGTNWSNANLPDTYEWDGEPYGPDNKAAAKELDYATIMLGPGERFDGELPLSLKTDTSYDEHVFQGVVAAKITEPRDGAGQDYAFAEGTGMGVLELDSLEDISDRVSQVGGTYYLDWTAPVDGQYGLFVYWMHGTGQTASPSVSVNYTVNYMDSYGIEALIDYWEEVVLTDELKATIRENGRGEIYMDSLELFTAGAGEIFWGYNLKDEFYDRKGYDITPYLPLLTMSNPSLLDPESDGGKDYYDYGVSDGASQTKAEKVRADFYSVMTDMYLENVLEPLQTWLHSLNMTLRAEPSYGTNFEISTPAKYIDGIETESFAQSADIDLYRGILGSANMYGRLFSSETGAVTYRNYYYNMDDWTQLCYLQFAEGVNRTVFHGYSGIEGSEADTYWPGHEGMYSIFSDRFNSRQPAAKDYQDWTEMLARNQKVLRQGTPARDVAILRTDNFYPHYDKPDEYSSFERNYMMYDMAYFWQDLSMQQAGYTYDYFSPLLLEDEDNVSWTSDALQPDGPAYQAIIVYQETMELSSAKALLEIAADGLPVLFVNNNPENLFFTRPNVQHGQAASVSKYLNDSDAELQAVVNQIKALPNVSEVDSPAEAMTALQQADVYPRVGYDQPNDKILTVSRSDEENDIFYTYAYSYKFDVNKDEDPYTFELVIEGEGTPYYIDDWTGEIGRVGTYAIKDGHTHVEVTLEPGESTIVALNLKDSGEGVHAVSTTADEIVVENQLEYALATASGQYVTTLSDGSTVTSTLEVPDAIALDTWDIVIEDWNEGDKVVNTEEKFGHVTREVYYTTKKTDLEFSDSGLMAWKDLPATAAQLAMLAGDAPSMAHVSGIGTYTADFTLPDDWSGSNGAYLDMESAGGGTVAVYVNGQKAPGVNTRILKLDISDMLVPGENTVCVEVASTLTNRMIQRGYGALAGWTDDSPTVQDYGLMGDVYIVPYAVEPLEGRHQPYVEGYPDGTFGGEGEITRAEAAAVIYRIMDDGDKTVAGESQFDDVSRDDWHHDYIIYVEEKGIVDGYPDSGEFKPDEAILREEFVKMVVAALGLEASESGVTPFSDVDPNQWSAGYIHTAYEAGLIKGYPGPAVQADDDSGENEFQPGETIKRSEAVAMVNRALGRCVDEEGDLLIEIPEDLVFVNPYSDLAEGDWYYDHVLEASIGHTCVERDGVEIWTALTGERVQ